MKIEMVRAAAAMADELGYIQSASWRAAYRGLIPDDFLESFTPENRAAVFRKLMPSNPCEIYLVRADGRAGGMAVIGKAAGEDLPDDVGEVHAICFLPEMWGKGVASQAMEFCLSRLREQAFKSVVLWVLEENLRARRFYEKTGFSFDGEKKEITLGKPLVEVRYSLAFSRGASGPEKEPGPAEGY